jgi:hypothetical protein
MEIREIVSQTTEGCLTDRMKGRKEAIGKSDTDFHNTLRMNPKDPLSLNDRKAKREPPPLTTAV